MKQNMNDLLNNVNNRWSGLPPKQRQFAIFCGAILLLCYVVHLINNAGRQAAYYRQQALRAAQQRAKAAPRPPAPPPAPWRPKGLTTLANLSGTWKGQNIVTGIGFCTQTLELRDTDAPPGNYTGYSTLSCIAPPNLWQLHRGPRMLPPKLREEMHPTAIMLNGAPENGAVHFRIDKSVVAAADGCDTTAFKVTPFGTNRIAVAWQDGICDGGQILLDRIGR
jgi:hypothetical protein